MPAKKKVVARRPRAKTRDSSQDIAILARDMMISAISVSGGSVPAGQDAREFVRAAREFYDEVSHPTTRPVKRSKQQPPDEDGDDLSGDREDDLLDGI